MLVQVYIEMIIDAAQQARGDWCPTRNRLGRQKWGTMGAFSEGARAFPYRSYMPLSSGWNMNFLLAHKAVHSRVTPLASEAARATVRHAPRLAWRVVVLPWWCWLVSWCWLLG